MQYFSQKALNHAPTHLDAILPTPAHGLELSQELEKSVDALDEMLEQEALEDPDHTKSPLTREEQAKVDNEYHAAFTKELERIPANLSGTIVINIRPAIDPDTKKQLLDALYKKARVLYPADEFTR